MAGTSARPCLLAIADVRERLGKEKERSGGVPFFTSRGRKSSSDLTGEAVCRKVERHESSYDGDWLGGRDSNPDRQIQSLQSYRWTTSQQRKARRQRQGVCNTARRSLSIELFPLRG
jgi:hypothetical protein